MNKTKSENIQLTPFYANIEKLTETNIDYRKVLYTGNHLQFVLMSLKPLDSIHMEIHKDHDQFIRIEKGNGNAIIGNKTFLLSDGIGLIIPAGVQHFIENTSKFDDLKLYTIYSPPEHPDGLIQHVNPDKHINHDNNSSKYLTKYIKYKQKYLYLQKYIK